MADAPLLAALLSALVYKWCMSAPLVPPMGARSKPWKAAFVAVNTIMRRRVMLADRAEAGRLLAERLAASAPAAPLVLALARGGVPVAAEIARALNAPLDVVFVRKIGAPDQPELAVGAIADGTEPEIVLNHKLVHLLDLSADYIASESARELAAIERRRREYEGLRPKVAPGGRTAIVVDDGVATGMTMQAALRQVKRGKPARLIAATPVASREAVAVLKREADEVVCLTAPRRFGSVGSFYRNFGQVSDEEVMALLREAAGHPASP
jgi:putative phosphoribosyl transferase